MDSLLVLMAMKHKCFIKSELELWRLIFREAKIKAIHFFKMLRVQYVRACVLVWDGRADAEICGSCGCG